MLAYFREKLALMAADKVYNRSLKEDGFTPEGVHWKNRIGQIERFELLLKITEPGPNLSINDFGCGYGALFQHMSELNLIKNGRYFGYDRNSKMIAAGRRMFNDQRAVFICSTRVTQIADYTIVSGTFNFKMHESDEFWWKQIQKNLKQCWEMSRKGLAFNLLSNENPPRMKELFSADTETVQKFCRNELSTNLRCIKGKNIDDITYLIRR